MQRKHTPHLLHFLLKVLVFLGILTGAYYYFWLIPHLERPSALASAERLLTSNQNNVLQSRIAILELLRLDPTAGHFATSQADLLQRLTSTHQEGEELLATAIVLPTLQDTLPERRMNELHDTHGAVLTNQKALYENIAQLQQYIAKIYEYNPTIDIGQLSTTDEKEMIRTRAEAAHNGLGTISDSLAHTNLSETAQTLMKNELQYSRELISVLIEETHGNDSARIATARDAFIRHFNQVKTTAKSAQNTHIRSNATITALKNHTNLLLAYDFWLTKINEQQAIVAE